MSRTARLALLLALSALAAACSASPSPETGPAPDAAPAEAAPAPDAAPAEAAATPDQDARPLIDATAIAPQTAEFEIRANGQPIGMQTVTVEQVPDGFVFRETTTTPAGSQSTEVRFTRELRMQSVEQRGEMRGQEVRIDVTYADGTTSGIARTPGPDGPREIEVNAPVPPDVVDDNVLIALVPGLPWGPAAEFTVPVFASGKNELAEYRFRVAGTDSVQVPAGSYEAYRAEITGADRPLVFHVEAGPRHRLLKISLSGTPLEIVRTSAH